MSIWVKKSKSINQSINQLISQSYNQSINQLMIQSFNNISYYFSDQGNIILNLLVGILDKSVVPVSFLVRDVSSPKVAIIYINYSQKRNASINIIIIIIIICNATVCMLSC